MTCPRSSRLSKPIDHDRPTCFICYTVKGFGLPFAGHKDNHAGLMTASQMEHFRAAMNIRRGHEWEPFEGLETSGERLEAFLNSVPFAANKSRRLKPRQDRGARASSQIAAPADNVDTGGIWGAAERAWPRQFTIRGAHRHHLSRCDGLHQSRSLGEPPRSVRPRTDSGHLQERAHPLDVQLGIFAQGPAHRARHRRDAISSSCFPRSGCRIRSTASAFCRSARCMTRSLRAGSML